MGLDEEYEQEQFRWDITHLNAGLKFLKEEIPCHQITFSIEY